VAGEAIEQSEEEPWWRVAGNPVTRVWPGPRGSGAEGNGSELVDLRMQFREDDANPKVISLRYAAGSVQVGLEDGAGG